MSNETTTPGERPRHPWEEPARIRRRKAAAGSPTCRRMRAVVALCRVLEGVCEEAADELDEGGAMSRHLCDPRHTIRLLRGLATQAEVVADLVGGDLPAGR